MVLNATFHNISVISWWSGSLAFNNNHSFTQCRYMFALKIGHLHTHNLTVYDVVVSQSFWNTHWFRNKTTPNVYILCCSLLEDTTWLQL